MATPGLAELMQQCSGVGLVWRHWPRMHARGVLHWAPSLCTGSSDCWWWVVWLGVVVCLPASQPAAEAATVGWCGLALWCASQPPEPESQAWLR